MSLCHHRVHPDLRARLRARGLAAGAVTVALLAASLRAQEPTILLFRNAFLPTFLTVEAGSTVTWVWRAGTHQVRSGVSSRPEDRPGELFDALVDEEHPSFSFTFATPGEYAFFDALNEQTGGVGSISVLSDARTFRVGVVDNTYIPENLAIFEGDTVHWEHEPGEMLHTVTSGRSSLPADHPGELFDAESSDAKPNFFFTFAAPGLVPYFCRPHEELNMIGTVRVQRYFVRGDANRDGSNDIADALRLLFAVFLGGAPLPCEDAADVDDDGQLRVGDAIGLLGHLFIRATPMPRPWPAPGPDRSDDELFCRD